MLFNSLEFILFLPIVVLLFYLLPVKIRWLWLLAASCFFYAFFIPSYLLILFLVILIDYLSGIKIESTRFKKRWLILSILSNLLLLGIFKYYNFFIAHYNELTGCKVVLLKIILPIGLSFHTFQSIAYNIEIYRGHQKAVRHLGYYSLFVLFFPQLVAGPIERAQHMFPQFFRRQYFSWQNIYEGLRLIIWGFVKKMVIADRLSEYVNAVFGDPSHYNSSAVIVAVLFFTLQIYADFSGYCDIAVGSARCLGFDLTINFNRPYQSSSIREFWQRWHISLSGWFRDYLYIPLGGNRLGFTRTQINLLVVFILSGFWHGAGFTFIAWGFLHGVYLVIYNIPVIKRIRLPAFAGSIITLLLVTLAWVLFRASSLSNASEVFGRLFNWKNINWKGIFAIPPTYMSYGYSTLLFITAMTGYMFFFEKKNTPDLVSLNKYRLLDPGLMILNIVLILFFGVFTKQTFIYFQF